MSRANPGTYNGKNRATRRKRLRMRPKKRKELSYIEGSLANAKDRGEPMLDAGLPNGRTSKLSQGKIQQRLQ